MSLLQEPIPKPHMPDAELDEAYHFALSLVPMLHRLDKDRRQQAKIEILTTLHNLEKAQHHQTVPPQHAAEWHPPTQNVRGHSTHISWPSGFQNITFPPQGDESNEGSYYRDM